MRKSLKSKRETNEHKKEVAQAKQEIRQLQEQEDQGLIDLFYFDESGFTLTPVVPYAWQKANEYILLPTSNSARINVLGFLNRKNDFISYMVQGSVNTDVVIACFDNFCEQIKKKTVVIIDNAPTHTSGKFKDKIPEWEKKGLRIKKLPTYSPELNLIEILWKHIKYYWLPFGAYLNFDALRKELEKVLKNIGTQYHITFA